MVHTKIMSVAANEEVRDDFLENELSDSLFQEDSTGGKSPELPSGKLPTPARDSVSKPESEPSAKRKLIMEDDDAQIGYIPQRALIDEATDEEDNPLTGMI